VRDKAISVDPQAFAEFMANRRDAPPGKGEASVRMPGICTGEDLAKALERTHLSEEEAEAWRRDLRVARKRLKPIRDKWGDGR
jgi:hypothetical protein